MPKADGQYSPLSRFYYNLPETTYASADKCCDRRMDKQKAKWYPYIGLDTSVRHYLAIDVDEGEAGTSWMDAELPEPTILALNKDNPKGHLLWELETPVVTNDFDWARSKPLHWYRGIEHAFNNRLQADRGFTATLIKNPLQKKDWRVISHDRAYSFCDLSRGLDPEETIIPWKKKGEIVGTGRNKSLFDVIRFWAYKAVHRFDSSLAFHNAVYEQTLAENSFAAPLPLSEVKSISTSVAKWTWENRNNISDKRKNEGIMSGQFDESCTTQDRQVAAAHRTAKVKRNATLQKIIEAKEKLLEDGNKATQKAVAQLAGLGIATVKRNWKEVQEK